MVIFQDAPDKAIQADKENISQFYNPEKFPKYIIPNYVHQIHCGDFYIHNKQLKYKHKKNQINSVHQHLILFLDQ